MHSKTPLFFVNVHTVFPPCSFLSPTFTMTKETSTIVDPTDAVCPWIALAHISTSFSGDLLNKTVGNWKIWSSKIHDNLAICGLGAHIKEIKEGTHPILDPNTHPVAYDNWTMNDSIVHAYMYLPQLCNC